MESPLCDERIFVDDFCAEYCCLPCLVSSLEVGGGRVYQQMPGSTQIMGYQRNLAETCGIGAYWRFLGC